ncbi:hypothetical protein MMC26_004579 [Xylographa opegraphella]|nr:hypothetical protein [Xylographa opegraphella]
MVTTVAEDSGRASHPERQGSVLRNFLQKDPIFCSLQILKDKGWANPEGDEHFKKQRSRADNTKGHEETIFYNMMQQIAEELQSQTQALSLSVMPGDVVRVLDLCMAPGGYSAVALGVNRGATVRGISLPRSDGGHNLLLRSNRPAQVECLFLDITMLASEFSVTPIPQGHPEHKSFITERPYLGQSFHLVFCDGQVLRTHTRPKHRENFEALRLTSSQLILALQRIATGGTLVMLLHKVDSWHCIQLLYQFSQFAQIRLFKPQRKHALRSSFYLVANNMQPEHKAAQSAVQQWKEAWWRGTFGGSEGTGLTKEITSLNVMQTVLDDFGDKFIQLARPVWQIQLEALTLVSGEKSNFQFILRLLNTNVDGKQKIMYALTKIKGVGRRYSNLVCKKADVDLNKRAGEITSEELERIVTIIQNPTQYKIPTWFLNRQRDIVDGKDTQVLANGMDSKLREDLERLKKIRAHRGLRHYWGLRVRGQHSKTTGRRGRTVGVSKKKG